MLEDAFEVPVRGRDTTQTLIVGAVLLLASVLAPLVVVAGLATSVAWIIFAPLTVLPGLVLLGYELEVYAAGVRDRQSLPSVVRWGGLIQAGVLSVLVRILYAVPFVGFVGLGVVLLVDVRFGVFGLTAGYAPPVVGLGMFALTLLAGASALAYAYFIPAVLSALAVEGIRAALSPRHILTVVARGEYATAWLIASATLVVGAAIALPLSLLLVGVVLGFYVRLVAAYAYGAGTTSVLRADVVDTAAGDVVPDERPPEAPVEIQTGRTVPVESSENGAFRWACVDERGNDAENGSER